MIKDVLRKFAKFTGKHLCQSLFFNFIKKKTLAQVFSCEFCGISKNTFLQRTPLVAASEFWCLTEYRFKVKVEYFFTHNSHVFKDN